MMASCVPLIRQWMHSCAQLGCVSTYSWNIISPKVDGLLQQVHLSSVRRNHLDAGQAAYGHSQQLDGARTGKSGRDGLRAPDRLCVGMRPGNRREIREACLDAYGAPRQPQRLETGGHLPRHLLQVGLHSYR